MPRGSLERMELENGFMLLSKDKAEMYAQLTDVYPNPSTGMVRVNWAADANATTTPEFWFSDQVGRRIELPVQLLRSKEAIVDFTKMPNGIYNAHFTYEDRS